MDSYRDLSAALAEDGIRCHFQSPGQMVVSAQVGPVWPDRGNSFWLTRVSGLWYLFTWIPVGYCVPDDADVAGLCRVCMSHGSGAMPRVPPHIADAFGLRELTDEDADVVIAEMGQTVEPDTPPDTP